MLGSCPSDYCQGCNSTRCTCREDEAFWETWCDICQCHRTEKTDKEHDNSQPHLLKECEQLAEQLSAENIRRRALEDEVRALKKQLHATKETAHAFDP